jgi:hypothetical protein
LRKADNIGSSHWKRDQLGTWGGQLFQHGSRRPVRKRIDHHRPGDFDCRFVFLDPGRALGWLKYWFGLGEARF